RNLPNVGFTQEQVQPLELPCTAYDKLLLLDHNGDGLPSLLTIPVWNPETHDWLPSAKWPRYHALRPDDGTLEDTGLPPDYAQRWRPHVIDNYNLSSLDDDFPKALQGYGLDQVLDNNGDGLPDILRYQLDIGDAQENLGVIMQTIVVDDPPLPEHGGLRLWLNTGAGFSDGGWAFPPNPDDPGDAAFRRFLAAGVLDYDGDGLLDLLTPVAQTDSDFWTWSIFRSNGDGTFNEHPNVLEAPVHELATRTHAVGGLDLDGDGLHEPAVFSPATAWDLRQHQGSAPDRLRAIENGLGARIEIDYRALTDIDAPEGFYESDLGQCAYPRRCETSPQIVVEAHRIGITSQPRAFTHRYGPARSDREGRRFLGFSFHELTEWAQDQPIYRRTVHSGHVYHPELQDFPFAGLPAMILEDQRNPATGQHVVTFTSNTHAAAPTTDQTYR
ncbi:MAG: VCBS repeat-containing protein, partial [Myxococcales bacterium]|nr:VCBS repeat-containing protein [Myxococcales bacterium]